MPGRRFSQAATVRILDIMLYEQQLNVVGARCVLAMLAALCVAGVHSVRTGASSDSPCTQEATGTCTGRPLL